MAKRYSSAEIFQHKSDVQQFRAWDNGRNEPDTDYVAHSKKCLMVALESELTETQRQYYTMYHLDGMTMAEIAATAGVSISCVSRTLKRANARLGNVLRYSAPHLLNASVQTKNRRVRDGK